MIESPEGFYIFRLDRSTVIRPAADFAGHDLGEVDRFFFNQWLFKAPINTLFLEYQVRTPVYLKSPGDPLPPRDSVLVQVGAQRLTLAELDDARAFYGRPPLEQHGLFRESWTNLQHMTLAERTRRMGLDGLASGSLGLADGVSAINQLFIKKKTLAGLGDRRRPNCASIGRPGRKSTARLPVVAAGRSGCGPQGRPRHPWSCTRKSTPSASASPAARPPKNWRPPTAARNSRSKRYARMPRCSPC